MLKTQLNIEAIKKVVEAAAVIGDGAKVEITYFDCKSREEVYETAQLLSEELNLQIFEGEYEKIKGGWFTVAESKYKFKVEITLHYSVTEV